MTTKELKELNNRFVSGRMINGEFLNDNDLEALYNFYDRLTLIADSLDSDFRLFRSELYRRLELLKGYKDARKGMKREMILDNSKIL